MSSKKLIFSFAISLGCILLIAFLAARLIARPSAIPPTSSPNVETSTRQSSVESRQNAMSPERGRSPTESGVFALQGTPTVAPSSIVMATDKTNYGRAEVIKLRVTNGLDIPIFYIAYPQRDLVFWKLERAQHNGWKRLDFRLPLIEGGIEVCRIILYERPIGAVTELRPHVELLYEWDQKMCPMKTIAKFEPEMIERGRYRFALRYSLDTVKEDSETQPWKRPIELGERKIVYSNEFVLE